jgi:5S rRNA maturation endonuclease (ribonuclease M5)
MTKLDELGISEDDIVIVGNSKVGWSNIETLEKEGNCCTILTDTDYSGIFTSDRE